MSDYIIHGGLDGKKRLAILSDVLQPYTKALLETNSIAKGSSFLDVGCGGGHVSLLAADCVGDSGSVTAIDFDEAIIALNQQEAMAFGITNIKYHAMSAYDMAFENVFDVAYSRFLLSHLTAPLAILKKMLRSVKPGGRIIVEDIDFSGHFCYPDCSAFTDYVKLFTHASEQRKQHPNIGPLLPSLFHEAGIGHVQFEIIQPAFDSGVGKWMAYITMDAIKEAVITQNLADQSTIDAILEELEVFTKDPNTIISLPRIFRVWGVK